MLFLHNDKYLMTNRSDNPTVRIEFLKLDHLKLFKIFYKNMLYIHWLIEIFDCEWNSRSIILLNLDVDLDGDNQTSTLAIFCYVLLFKLKICLNINNICNLVACFYQNIFPIFGTFQSISRICIWYILWRPNYKAFRI